MQLYFCKVGENRDISIFKFDIHRHFIHLITENNNISSDKKKWVFLFDRVDFDSKSTEDACSTFFQKIKQIERIVVSEDAENYRMTYKFNNVSEIEKNLSKDDMLFLCTILHNLNLKTYLTAFLAILFSEKYGMTTEDVLLYVKDDRLKIFYKLICVNKYR